MDGGYVLAHVLEAVVPGHDLGDGPSCEIALGESAVQCPIPSTLQSENVALSTGGDSEPVVHVRAYDTEQRSVGLVVVPVNTLVPLEVWNVWYAMDEGVEEAEEKPPEETPKMHLLLQYVSGEAAAEETAQLREMRAQDFLLRALQQLNASLEAKVLVHQGKGASVASTSSRTVESAYPAAPPLPHGNGLSSAPAMLGLTATPPPSAGSTATPPPAASVRRASPPPSAPSSLPPAPPAYAQPAGQRTSQYALVGGEEAGAGGANAKQSAAQLAQKVQIEELLRARVEPYERVIAALEEKQKFYDDQESRVRVLTKNLEEQEQKQQGLYFQLQELTRKRHLDVEAEQEIARKAHGTKASLDQRVVELQQEVALRRAHEDSLQKRVTLMESELTVVHQKYVLVDAMEEETQSLKRDLQAQKDLKEQIQEKLRERDGQVAQLQDENWRFRDGHCSELEKIRSLLIEETRKADQAQYDLQSSQDTARDKHAEKQLMAEKLEDMTRQLVTFESEVASYRTMLERERQHRRDLEQKLEDQELRRLNSTLDEHKQIIKGLREEVAKAKREHLDERTRATALETEFESSRREHVRGLRQVEDSRQRMGVQDELREDARKASARSEELKKQIKSVAQDTSKMTEHYEREITEHAKVQQQLCQERDDRQKEVCDLRANLSRMQQRIDEVTLIHEQSVRTLASAKDSADRSEDLQRQLQLTQEELHRYRASRDEIHGELERLMSKFRDDTFARDKRSGELETMLEDRSNEIKLLMYRVQELSSKYLPAKGDSIDVVLSKWINGYRPAVPFFRLAQGVYLFGRRQVICKISNDKPVFRVGGGFVGFDKFLELYASEELERLLTYEIDERTGEPKFVDGQRARQALEESGAVEELRERAEQSQAAQHGGRVGGAGPRGGGAQHSILSDRRRPLNSSALTT